MRTAIFNSNFWKDESVYELSIDARMLYLCLITNPEKNTTPAFKIADRLLTAYTGFNSTQLEVARKMLITKKLIEIIDGYYIVTSQEFVEPRKGKLSDTLYERDVQKLPTKVQERLKSHSGATPELVISNSNKLEVRSGTKQKNHFDEWWGVYPKRRVDKEKCRTKFGKFPEDVQLSIIQDTQNRASMDDKWIKGFVPMTSTYLNNKKWEDDYEKVEEKTTGVKVYE